ncbi:MAG: zinc ABC transporter substrate-binding protein, partial [Clostridiales bacterium]|nr:zinc ABC transporter substrate-binding protein [Clostridiales bacterium]
LVVVDASKNISLLQNEHAEESHDHDQQQEHHHEHQHEQTNPHIWLDVKNAIQMVKNLSEGMMAAFPDERNAIEENMKEYILRLEILDQELHDGLETLPNKEIITFHEAFPYFAKAYGLEVIAVMANEPEEGLTPKELSELIGLIENHPGVRLFVEPQYPSLAAQTIQAQTGAIVAQLDPLTTGSAEEALTFYETGMRANMEVLQETMKDSQIH